MRFFYAGKTSMVGESEVSLFQRQLVQAEHAYMCATGRSPTHLVLGKEEQGKWAGWMSIEESRGRLRGGAEKHKATFRGMIILHSSAPNCVMAVEQEGFDGR